jgi:hypothetical protein
MKQRLGIASTLLRDPELIILDEPTNGLDPAGKKEVRDLIPQLSHESRAVLLCSHLLNEVEMVCNRVAIIKKGIMVANAPIKELLSRGQTLQIKVDALDQAAAILSSLPWIKSVKKSNDILVVDAPEESASTVNKVLAEHNLFASEIVSRNWFGCIFWNLPRIVAMLRLIQTELFKLRKRSLTWILLYVLIGIMIVVYLSLYAVSKSQLAQQIPDELGQIQNLLGLPVAIPYALGILLMLGSVLAVILMAVGGQQYIGVPSG